ncbi:MULTISPECIES: hypothetical protein [Enterobacteriaceae]|uniref:hypothetical protein n=1 Tax=Enterobacteriaceae TaxID=543 RepID=UPI00075D9CFC|nr:MULTISPECIES: hypothetical protein [Enterobacteriaceae]EAR0931466.1 hypothetical protein [Salmonella enterica]EBQ8953514.1 hypothetical protein [Salmonella enterica subsp. enterica serovar Montevideo]EBV8518236.1 hypothetical protein [Salmonella enterica subsp. enterica serovar Mbandaka]HCB1874855.1 hypothetical protein [Citrobacter freundii]EKF1231038.1 hypothetical protein [Salmonella enterica]
MGYIILKGLFEPDSVAHFAGSLICIVLCSMIIYVVLYDLANNFKTHCKSVINEVGNALFYLMFAILVGVSLIILELMITYTFIRNTVLITIYGIYGLYFVKGDKE